MINLWADHQGSPKTWQELPAQGNPKSCGYQGRVQVTALPTQEILEKPTPSRQGPCHVQKYQYLNPRQKELTSRDLLVLVVGSISKKTQLQP